LYQGATTPDIPNYNSMDAPHKNKARSIARTGLVFRCLLQPLKTFYGIAISVSSVPTPPSSVSVMLVTMPLLYTAFIVVVVNFAAELLVRVNDPRIGTE
jgi:hypothetical protein